MTRDEQPPRRCASTALRALRAGYDAAAAAYTRLVPGLGPEQPLERGLIAEFARRTRGARVLDAGCGPGRLAPALTAADVTGVDLAPAMVAIARARHPDARFAAAALDALPFATGTFAGVVAWYSLIHTAPDRLPATLAELGRVLGPGGHLLLGFQAGTGSRLIPDAYGSGHDLLAYLFTTDQIADVLGGSGYAIDTVSTRDPVGERHRQGFVLVRKSAGTA